MKENWVDSVEFLSGYIEDRVAAGEQREYSYPENGVPTVNVDHLEILPSYAAARRAADLASSSCGRE